MEDNDEITVKEVQELVKKVEEFCAERPEQKTNLIWLADVILKRLYKDLDSYVNVEGQKGFGKSNFTLLLAILQCRYSGIWKNKKTGKLIKVLPRTGPPYPIGDWEHIKFGFQFNRNMSFLDKTEDLKKKFFSLDRYMPFIVDEGSKNLHKHQWATKLQFLLVQMSDTERYQNKSFYVCFPNFKELNSTFRNDRIGLRVYIYAKNVSQRYSSAIISLKDVNRHIPDPWHTDENAQQFEYLLRHKPIANRTAKDILYAEKKLKGFAGNFDIPALSDLAPRIWNIYMKYKIMNAQKENIEGEEEKESVRIKKWKNHLGHLVFYLENKLPQTTNLEIAEAMNMSLDAFNAFKTKIKKELTTDVGNSLLES